MDSESLRKKMWIYVFLWVGFIYSTVYIVRPLRDFLDEHTPFAFLTSLFIVVLFFVVIFWMLKKLKHKDRLTYLLLTFAAFIYAYTLMMITYPAEKIHLFQYGFLALLIYRASLIDFDLKSSYVIAFFLTSSFGWIDEIIQYYIPNRYYHINDVMLNSFSGIMGLFLIYVFNRANHLNMSS